MVKRSVNIRVALMGCGRIAKKHAEVITGMVGSGIVLVAVCDPDIARARRFSQKYDVAFSTGAKDFVLSDDIELKINLKM